MRTPLSNDRSSSLLIPSGQVSQFVPKAHTCKGNADDEERLYWTSRVRKEVRLVTEQLLRECAASPKCSEQR